MLRDPDGRVCGNEANEWQIQDLKEKIENEVHAAHKEYLKLESQIGAIR